MRVPQRIRFSKLFASDNQKLEGKRRRDIRDNREFLTALHKTLDALKHDLLIANLEPYRLD